MSRHRRALLPALMEGLGIFLIGLFGADAMWGADLRGLGLSGAAAPALAVALAVVAYRYVSFKPGEHRTGCGSGRHEPAPVSRIPSQPAAGSSLDPAGRRAA